jgi:hypothetical protein
MTFLLVSTRVVETFINILALSVFVLVTHWARWSSWFDFLSCWWLGCVFLGCCDFGCWFRGGCGGCSGGCCCGCGGSLPDTPITIVLITGLATTFETTWRVFTRFGVIITTVRVHGTFINVLALPVGVSVSGVTAVTTFVTTAVVEAFLITIAGRASHAFVDVDALKCAGVEFHAFVAAFVAVSVVVTVLVTHARIIRARRFFWGLCDLISTAKPFQIFIVGAKRATSR